MTFTDTLPTSAPAGSGPLAIDLQGLHKSFGNVRAVDGIDLAVTPGEVVAFLGPNGAGKTTTIDMLLGLAQTDQGSVSVLGLDPSRAIAEGRVWPSCRPAASSRTSRWARRSSSRRRSSGRRGPRARC